MTETIGAEYVNIFIFSPLSASSYIELPNKLKNSIKGLVNINKNDNKCFLWCHIKHLNPLKAHPERIGKADKKMVNDLDYEGIEFHISKEGVSRIKQKNNVCINVFYYKNGLTYPVYVSNETLENCSDLLMITDENKSHYVYIKDFNRFL